MFQSQRKLLHSTRLKAFSEGLVRISLTCSESEIPKPSLKYCLLPKSQAFIIM